MLPTPNLYFIRIVIKLQAMGKYLWCNRIPQVFLCKRGGRNMGYKMVVLYVLIISFSIYPYQHMVTPLS